MLSPMSGSDPSKIYSSGSQPVTPQARRFTPAHITMDEGEVKLIKRDQIATYPNVNSCFTITVVLDDETMVGAHLVSPTTDELEKKRREEAGIREADQVLPTMKSLIGDRKIKELVVAGSLQESKEITKPVQVQDPLGQQVRGPSGQQVRDSSGQQVRGPSGQQVRDSSGQQVRGPSGQQARDLSGQQVRDPSGQQARDLSGQQVRDPSGQVLQKYKSDSWKGSDIIPAVTQELDGADIITGLISAYFEENLQPYTVEGEGFKAKNHTTSVTALIMIKLEGNKAAHVEIRDQKKYDEDPAFHNSIRDTQDCFTHHLIKDKDTLDAWLGLKAYWED